MPGERLCTPMPASPFSTNSAASVSFSCFSAILVALCVTALLENCAPNCEKPRLKMWNTGCLPSAPGCWRMTRMASRQHSSDPSTLVPTTRDSSDGSTSASSFLAVTSPALLIHTSTRPSVCCAIAPSLATDSGSDTSHSVPDTLLAPNSFCSAATALWTRSGLRPQSITWSPACRNSRAMAKPTPLVPPVITMFLAPDVDGPDDACATILDALLAWLLGCTAACTGMCTLHGACCCMEMALSPPLMHWTDCPPNTRAT
mmetsp:Transcript_25367/g.64436  ORF Transcript_25367/g.64436 Transcript_25367/m.64436 type:complete len:259 (-) Transcript_25367:147-923(-)